MDTRRKKVASRVAKDNRRSCSSSVALGSDDAGNEEEEEGAMSIRMRCRMR